MIKGDNYLFFPANIERRISRLQIITEYYSTYAVGQIAVGARTIIIVPLQRESSRDIISKKGQRRVYPILSNESNQNHRNCFEMQTCESFAEIKYFTELCKVEERK